MAQVQTKNRMGSMPIPQLIIRSSIPLILSMMLNALAVFIDSIFLSRVSEAALTALALVTPLQMVVQALGGGIAIGFNAAFSKALGEQDREKANRITSVAIFLGIVAYLLIVVLCLTAVRPYLAWQSGGDETVASYGVTYLFIYMLCSIGQMAQWVFDRLVIASGRSSLFLITLSVASVVHLVLDPILIFGAFGFPGMGITGAALALVIGQAVGGTTGYFINRKYTAEVDIRFTLRPDMGCVGEILRVGIPTFLMQMITSLLGMVVNTTLHNFSSGAVAAYGICVKSQGVISSCVNGINLGLIPIIAYNYGARQKERIYAAIRWAFVLGLSLFSIFFLLLELFPGLLLGLFGVSEELYDIGMVAIRIMLVYFLEANIFVLLTGILQGFGKGTQTMVLNCARQLVLMLVLLLLSRFGRLELVWTSFVIAELLLLPFGWYIFRQTRKTVIETL